MLEGSFLGWVAPGSHSEPCPTVHSNMEPPQILAVQRIVPTHEMDEFFKENLIEPFKIHLFLLFELVKALPVTSFSKDTSWPFLFDSLGSRGSLKNVSRESYEYQ